MTTHEPDVESHPPHRVDERQVAEERRSTEDRRPALRRPPTEAHREKLELIKAAAAELFFTVGYAAADLRSIADSAQMHVTSLYNYISSKEELLYLIMRDGMDNVAAGLDQAVANAEDPVERLRTALESHFLHHLHRQHLAWVSHVEVRALTGEYRTEIMRLRKDYEDRWIEMVSSGMQAGRLRQGDARILTYGLLSVAQSLSRWYRPGGRVSAEQVSVMLADMLLNGLVRSDGRPPDSGSSVAS